MVRMKDEGGRMKTSVVQFPSIFLPASLIKNQDETQ